MTVALSKSEDIFTPVLNVMNLEPSDQLWQALSYNGYTMISDIITLDKNDINELEYVETVGGVDQTKPVLKKQRKLLDHTLKWRNWKGKQLDTFKEDEWLRLTANDFENLSLTDSVTLSIRDPLLSQILDQFMASWHQVKYFHTICW